MEWRAGCPLKNGIILDPAQGMALCMSGLIGAELSGVPRFSDDEGRDDEGKAIDIGRRAHPDDDIAQASLHARGDELAHALLTAPYPNPCAVAEALLQKRKRRVDLEALLNGCQENSDASI